MIYKLDGINIASFGAKPLIEDECIALSGMFDLPARKGTTEYSWGTTIEPFVEPDDIELDGRTLSLSMLVKSEDYKSKLSQLKSACIACKELYTEFASFAVIQKDEIKVEEYPEIGVATVTVDFWQQNYIIQGIILIPSNTGAFRIDEFNLNDFGIFISQREGIEDVAKRIEVNTTLPYIVSTFRQSGQATLSCYMKGKNLQDLYLKMMQFHSLCASSGFRKLTVGNDLYNIYFKDGITASVIHNELLEFDLKFQIV